MSGATAVEDTGDSGEQDYLRPFVVVFALLVVTHLPVVNLIGFIPFLKEILFGALVVATMTTISDGGEAAKFALVVGMAAAVVFNLFWIPANLVFGGLFGAAAGGAEGAATGLSAGVLRSLGSLTNIIGLIFLSPIGYAVGGLIGSFFN